LSLVTTICLLAWWSALNAWKVGQRLDELVHELLRADVDDPRVRPLLAKAMGDRVHQVRLSEPGPAADEERVVPSTTDTGSGHRRRVRELVRRSDDEVRERVLLVQPFDHRRQDLHARRREGCQRPSGRKKGVAVGRRIFRRRRSDRERPRLDRRKRRSVSDRMVESSVDDPPDLDAQSRRSPQALADGRQKVVVDPLTNELVAGPEAQDTVGEPVELDAGEPLVEARGRLLAREAHGLRPRAAAYDRPLRPHAA
jgi:hypothetical protein